MPKYAYSSRFILENVLYLGAKQLDALNLFETFFFSIGYFFNCLSPHSENSVSDATSL